jgi:hypothetical protein
MRLICAEVPMRCLNIHSPRLSMALTSSDQIQLYKTQIWSTVVAIVSLCAHYTTFLMATAPTKADKGYWVDAETDALIKYMYDHRAEAGDGNFKASTFTGASIHLKKLAIAATPKTPKQLKYKWTAV